MPALEQIAHFVGRRDEVPNQQLAARLAAAGDHAGVAEMAANLRNPNPSIASDCLKVMYEVGYLAPELIAPYAELFVGLLRSKRNRMVWGGMIALSTIAALRADDLFAERHAILDAMSTGTLITVDAAVQTLATIAAYRPDYREALLPVLLERLSSCTSRDVPRYAEKILAAVDAGSCSIFSGLLTRRLPELNASGGARVRRVLRQANGQANAGQRS